MTGEYFQTKFFKNYGSKPPFLTPQLSILKKIKTVRPKLDIVQFNEINHTLVLLLVMKPILLKAMPWFWNRPI